ncbi:MAG TPA: ribbon-helix-helix domain-containing protein [Azospirillaceae bacterium]|nr:ribbon-helix-helix domain-containing protein [Azospirillaceae bacterium]
MKDRDPGATTPVGRSVTVAGRRMTVRLEPALWQGLEEIAAREERSVADLCAEVGRGGAALAPALREFILAYYRSAAAPPPVPTGFAEDGSEDGAGAAERWSPQFRAALDALR